MYDNPKDFSYLDYHCACIPENFSIQYPLDQYYSVPLRCMTCMEVVRVKTQTVCAENAAVKQERYNKLVVNKEVFKQFKLPTDPYNDDFGW